MLLRYFYDDRLAQASYLVGCAKTGEALVIDPARTIAPYLAAARKEGLRITHVTETHIHADFVSGSRELAAATGATIYLSDMGDADWKYGYADEPNVISVYDGDTWMVGNIKVEVLHTPGHTPEHIAFQITDTAGADKPIGVFTGDFLFAGDVGRPDLLEEAAGMMGTKEPGARKQFVTVQRFKAMADYLQIWPGHGAGSACGKALGAIPSTTLGYEKLFNPAFQFASEQPFVDWLLDGQPEAPRYFAQMKKVNKIGPVLTHDLPGQVVGNRTHLEALIAQGAQVFDLRERGDFAASHLPGSISVPAGNNSYLTYLGWLVDYQRPVHLVAPAGVAPDAVLAELRTIGVDDVRTLAGPESVSGGDGLPQITARELAERLPRNGIAILDVRGKAEYAAGHIRNARHIMLGHLTQRLAELPRETPLVVVCASGYRSQIATSLLEANGLRNAVSLTDGAPVWSRLLPVEQGEERVAVH
jgi:hydroxyacylglutathione hydrolase